MNTDNVLVWQNVFHRQPKRFVVLTVAHSASTDYKNLNWPDTIGQRNSFYLFERDIKKRIHCGCRVSWHRRLFNEKDPIRVQASVDQMALFPTSKLSPVFLFKPHSLYPIGKVFPQNRTPLKWKKFNFLLATRDGNNSSPGKGLGKVICYHVINKSHCSPFVNQCRIT